jgi:hypothetical protein
VCDCELFYLFIEVVYRSDFTISVFAASRLPNLILKKNNFFIAM